MKLKAIVVDGKRKWELLESFGRVPAGFVTDGASVPRFLWWWMSPSDPKLFKAAIKHDYDYCYGVDRREADKRFLHSLLSDGYVFAWPAWLAVRLFGWIYYPSIKK